MVGHLQRDFPEIGGRPHGFQHFLLLLFFRGQALLGSVKALAVSDSDSGPGNSYSKPVEATVGFLGRGGVAQDIVGELLVHHLPQTRPQVVIVFERDASRSHGQVIEGHALLPAVLSDQQGFVDPETAVVVVGEIAADVVHGTGFQPGNPDGVEDNTGRQRPVDQALQVIAKRAVQEARREQHQGFLRLHRAERADMPPQEVQQAPAAALSTRQLLGSKGPYISLDDLLARIEAGFADADSRRRPARCSGCSGANPAVFGF